MSDELADFYVHTAIVETAQGTDGYGRDHYADPVTLDPGTDSGCFVEQKRRLVLSSDATQVISETTVYAAPSTAALFAPNSRVTIGGVAATVISAAVNDSGDLDLPDHVAVYLT